MTIKVNKLYEKGKHYEMKVLFAHPGTDADSASYINVLETDGEAVTVSEIKDFCNKNGLALNAMFSACFGHLLNAYLNTESSVFAGIYNGRSDSRLLNTVAMLVKTIPIAGRAKPGETVKGNFGFVEKGRAYTGLVSSMKGDILVKTNGKGFDGDGGIGVFSVIYDES